MADDGGLARFQRRMRAIPASVRATVMGQLPQIAEEVAEAQRLLAPENEGRLKQSIRVEPMPEQLAVAVRAGGPTTTRPVRAGSTVTYDYALAQEFGRKGMDANPFFWPGFRMVRKRVTNKIKLAIRKAIRDPK